MVVQESGATVTILFSDLVSSTELLQRAGDESAQRIFQAHHRLLQDAVSANGGHEVKWLGDGLMVAFPSAADAVRCAIAMQQFARRATANEELEVRVGLTVGEAMVEESDYFGTPVVIAKRLCDDADGGQILCSSLVAGLLTGRQAFQFRDIGEKLLKGIPEPVQISEVLYEAAQPGALLRHIPFVGREEEANKLQEMLQEARAGRGGLAMVVGEPGIGKTRLADEFADAARTSEAVVLWGRCYEGEWAPPYGPFAEAIQTYAGMVEPDDLKEDLGAGASTIARLVPSLKHVLSDVEEPVKLEPDEERFRLFDAVGQFLIAASARAPLVLMLDDLHWADNGSIAMLRHLARDASRHRLLLLGTYRDVELDRKHPLADALGALRRETNFERILLKGLDVGEVGTLISTLGERDVPEEWVRAISAETDGNPFFIREILLHLIETGAFYLKDGEWTSDATSIEELGIPEGVREVIGRRLSLLSDDANGLLTAASAFSGAFRFDVAGQVAGLDDSAALDALDDALGAQIISATSQADSFTFTHALIRQTLYGELSPPRQVRLHRQVAEALERAYGEEANENAAELAYQYHRSSTLPGVEHGVQFALAAADQADETYARDESVTFLQMALELLPEDDESGRLDVLRRLSTSLAWALAYDDAVKTAREAAAAIASAIGDEAAADYVADVVSTILKAGSIAYAMALAPDGLEYIGERRDLTWAWLALFDLLRQEAEDPDSPGIPLESPIRDEIRGIVAGLSEDDMPPFVPLFDSRAEVLAEYMHVSRPARAGSLLYQAGELLRGAEVFTVFAKEAEGEGRTSNAATAWSHVARSYNALGDFSKARDAYRHGRELAARLPLQSIAVGMLLAARFEWSMVTDEGWEDATRRRKAMLEQAGAEGSWALSAFRASYALSNAKLDESELALELLSTLVAPLERAPAWAPNYVLLACDAASVLWLLKRVDHIETFERGLRDKVIAPDFRYPMQDGRLALAQLCALQERYDEASDWLAKARTVLEEQGARPLRAIVDFDEALMYDRRGEEGDAELEAPLLEAALAQFRELDMTGWIRRVEELQQS